MNEWNIIDKFLSRQRLAQIEKLVPENSVVCDIGCANGELLISLQDRIVKGIGIDRKVIRSNNENKKIKFLNNDIDGKHLPIENDFANCIIFLAVLEHLNYPKETVAEIYRILKKDGILLMTIPSPRSKPILELLALFHIINKREIRDHKKYWNKKELINLLKETGFSEINFSYFQFGMNQRIIAKK